MAASWRPVGATDHRALGVEGHRDHVGTGVRAQLGQPRLGQDGPVDALPGLGVHGDAGAGDAEPVAGEGHPTLTSDGFTDRPLAIGRRRLRGRVGGAVVGAYPTGCGADGQLGRSVGRVAVGVFQVQSGPRGRPAGAAGPSQQPGRLGEAGGDDGRREPPPVGEVVGVQRDSGVPLALLDQPRADLRGQRTQTVVADHQGRRLPTGGGAQLLGGAAQGGEQPGHALRVECVVRVAGVLAQQDLVAGEHPPLHRGGPSRLVDRPVPDPRAVQAVVQFVAGHVGADRCHQHRPATQGGDVDRGVRGATCGRDPPAQGQDRSWCLSAEPVGVGEAPLVQHGVTDDQDWAPEPALHDGGEPALFRCCSCHASPGPHRPPGQT